MFTDCESLTSLNLTGFNTKKVESMSGLFKGCINLKTIVFGDDFITERVINMESMFSNCISLTSLSLKNFDTKLVYNMREMFFSCTNLTYLDLTSFNTINCVQFDKMFGNIPKISIKLNQNKTENLIEEIKNWKNVEIIDEI